MKKKINKKTLVPLKIYNNLKKNVDLRKRYDKMG